MFVQSANRRYDHLGATSASTNAAGALTANARYNPYGGLRADGVPTDYKFTGQRIESTLGPPGYQIYDFGARFYDPVLGRFVSADSVVPGAGNPQALNRYSYVFNDPLKYVDPTGHCAGILGWVRGLPGYATTCDNLGLANDIAHDDRASVPEKALAVGYIGLEVAAHAVTMVGSAGVVCGLTPACAAVVEPALGIGTSVPAACAVTDCATNVETASERGITMLGSFPDYLDQAKAYEYKFFNMPADEWKALGSKAEQWKRNVDFLKERVTAGDIFRINEPVQQVMEAKWTWLKKELTFLFANGYELWTDADGVN